MTKKDKENLQCIIKAVKNTGYSLEELKIKDKQRERVFVRNAIVYLIRNNTTLNLRQTGEIINRNHASVLHAEKKITNALGGFDSEQLEYLNNLKMYFELEKAKFIPEEELQSAQNKAIKGILSWAGNLPPEANDDIQFALKVLTL